MNNFSDINSLTTIIAAMEKDNQVKYYFHLIMNTHENYKIEITKEQYGLLIDYYQEEEFHEEEMILAVENGIAYYTSIWRTIEVYATHNPDIKLADLGNHKNGLMIILEKDGINTTTVQNIVQLIAERSYIQQFPYYGIDEL